MGMVRDSAKPWNFIFRRVKIYIDLFITGITLGWGPCLSFCTPLVLPYVAATQKGWLSGLKATLVFSFSRIISYMLLSSASVILGQHLVRNFYESERGSIVYIFASVFILLLGAVILIGKYPRPHICRFLTKHIGPQSIKGMIFLGILVGMLPCLPLLGVLTYIAFTSQNVFDGMLSGLIFGIGTLISPLVLLGAFAGEFSSFLSKRPLIYRIFSRLCGLILMYLGIEMAIRILI